VPFTEELIKALPVALYLGLMARRQGWKMAASDGLLIGFVVGAGFAFHEDAMARRVSGSGWLAFPWSIFFPTLAPSRSPYHSPQIILGHAGWTALVGLALGLAFLYRRYRTAWLLPFLGLGLVILDHGLSNYYSNLGRHAAPALISLLRDLLLRGRLVIICLLLGIVVAVVLDWRILRWAAGRDRFFRAMSLSALLAELHLPLSWPRLLRLQAMCEYLRRRRAAYYALWTWRPISPNTEQADHMVTTLFSLGIDAGLPL
jgi:hypothetical protein